MKNFSSLALFFLAALLIIVAAIFDQSSMGWPLQRPLVEFLAQKTGRSLPGVTAVVLPLVDNVLVPQDVALALRASWGFHPKEMIVAEPMGDFSNGPFSLIREGVETGSVQGIPFCQSYAPPQTPKGLFLAKAREPRVVALDDFLLKREEMERGAIRPDLDIFFRGQTVLIGGPNAMAQAKQLQAVQEQLAVRHLNLFIYSAMVLTFVLGSMLIASCASIDLALGVVFFILFYAIGSFFLFRATGILLPLFLPVATLLLVFLKKIIVSCTTAKER